MTETPLSPTARRPRSIAAAVVKALRPRQWSKNLFVFGPLLFSHHMTEPDVDIRSAGAFALFCLASSAVYLLNDLLDLEADRQHPVKRLRPIASGEISRHAALAIAVVLAAAAISGSMLIGLLFTSLVAAYIVLNISYSLGLKNVVILDVMMIGTGFVLRVLGGVAAISRPGAPVSPSHWLVLCTILLSVFLAFTKRRAELTLLEDKASDHRKVLTSYSLSFLDQMISVVTAATLMCYILYTVDERTVNHVAGGSRGLLLTVPFVMYGIFRYLYIVYHRETGDNPAAAVMGDRTLLVSLALWALLCSAVVYYPEAFRGWFSP